MRSDEYCKHVSLVLEGKFFCIKETWYNIVPLHCVSFVFIFVFIVLLIFSKIYVDTIYNKVINYELVVKKKKVIIFFPAHCLACLQ